MSKHTPGPWKLATRKEGWVVKTRDGCVLAGVSQFPPPAEMAPQCEFNARLIAAAPELLEALKKARRFVLSSNDPVGLELIEIDSAIAKATGEQV